MVRTRLVVAALVLSAGAAHAQSKAPTVDQLISLKRAGGPAISPDGQSVAYTVREANWDDNNYHTEVWLADVKTGVLRQLTSHPKKSSTAPAWAPDGSTLAFATDRDDKRQIYLIDPRGGEGRRLTSVDEGVGAFAWAPDGKSIAFATDRGPTTDFTKMVFSPLQLATIDIASGQVSVFSPFTQGKHINPQYTPDGRSLFFISDQDGFSDIYRLELASGAVARVTSSKLKELVITDTIQPSEAVRVARNIRVLSIATLIGEAIGRTAAEESVSSLFD